MASTENLSRKAHWKHSFNEKVGKQGNIKTSPWSGREKRGGGNSICNFFVLPLIAVGLGVASK